MGNAIALQDDGRIVVGGEINSLAGVLRLNPNGTLDPSFGTAGLVTIPGGLGGGVQVIGVAIQQDGKIVAGISLINSGIRRSFSLARLNANGSLDGSFSSDGVATTFPFGQQRSPTVLSLQPDGKILLAGDGVIARYQTNGQLDSGFGSGGLAPLTAMSVTAIALQPNGQILIAGGGPERDTFPPGVLTLSTAGLIARYNSNGSLDKSFGSGGQAASLVAASGLAVEIDGKIVVAGGLTSRLVPPPAGNDRGFGVARYNPNGSLDTTFGNRGLAVTDFGPGLQFGEAFAVAIANGEIIAVGIAGQNLGVTGPVPSEFAIARYVGTGQLDVSFGTGGIATTTFGTNTASISALAIQTDGKIVVAGDSGSNQPQGFVNNIAVARYLGQ